MSKRLIQTVMSEISEEEERLIDNLKNEVLELKRGSRTFNILSNQIYCYGEVDFNNKNDADTIEHFKFLDFLGSVGIPIYSNYDYNKHIARSSRRNALWTETWSPLLLAKFAHAALGKPKRIILFKAG